MGRHYLIIVCLICLTACLHENGELDVIVAESSPPDAHLVLDADSLRSDFDASSAALDMGNSDGDMSGDAQLAVDQSSFDGAVVSFDMMPDLPSSDVASDPMDSGALDEGDVFTCPQLPAVNECLFGLDTRRLLENSAFTIELLDRHFEPTSLSILERLAFVQGFECGGLFNPLDAEEAFSLIDSGGLRRYRVAHRSSQQSFDWYKFYMGDTEVGYLYTEVSLSMVAIISDGDINRCQVSK